MNPLKQIPVLLASLALSVAVAQAAPGPADVAAMRTYVARNRAYSPATRAEALRRLELLPGLTGTPARFELEAAHIAALIERCRRGPPAARVDEVEEMHADEALSSGFEQRPTA